MSKRRHAGEWVWLLPGAGFVGESNRLQAEIQPEDEPEGCPLCNDPYCQEWSTLLTEPDPQANNARFVLFHVSECEMFSEPQLAEG